ncbi:RHS repeat-associated protein [Aquimarina sp. EL_43]|uniref:RHS repeat domain-containing protein n=1 Tax=unclassified Aquimarina TaxID=2627091 RepID=UPI0018C9488B|nr:MULTISPECIES: RHS repeat-associated core domain-containing protein [unclassified Aquimarina]MBG6133202.1 RHS repeat-associated protein [Aquimarina sp. EL_35]MBG6153360.1 RHS repeat-associated protein [Aquimarina sp. EL_32]MBG6171371.1 RHS repeat-associated protein [Aquimarina sp. EL_43]
MYKNGTLEFFNHTEGIVEHEADGYKYVYQFKDHLGNIRLSYKDADKNGSISTSEIVEVKDYYPFGLEMEYGIDHPNSKVNGRKHNYDYLGQERQEELGLNWLTFRYRNYIPEIGRFFGVDPVSEDYMSISTYQFAHNSPVWKIEIEGLEGEPTAGVDVVSQEPVKNSPRKGMSAVDVVKSVDVGVTIGFGETFGVSGKVFGLELGGSYDGGTTSYSGSIQDGTSVQATEGYSANFFVFGYGKETSTDLTNSPAPASVSLVTSKLGG